MIVLQLPEALKELEVRSRIMRTEDQVHYPLYVSRQGPHIVREHIMFRTPRRRVSQGVIDTWQTAEGCGNLTLGPVSSRTKPWLHVLDLTE